MLKIHGYMVIDKIPRKIKDLYVEPNFDFDVYLKVLNAQKEDNQLTGYLLTIVDCGDEGQED